VQGKNTKKIVRLVEESGLKRMKKSKKVILPNSWKNKGSFLYVEIKLNE